MTLAPPAGSVATVFADGRFVHAGRIMRCALGRAGIHGDKREGDGATPAGRLPLRRILYRADRGAVPSTLLPREPIGAADGWCDDPGDAAYNLMARLPYPGRCESLWRQDSLYDVVAILGWNDAPVERGRGSAIFLHVAGVGYPPTDGCVALAASDLRAVLASGLTELNIAL